MKSGFLQVDNISLFYREQNEEAPFTVFFFHGNSSSSQVWRYQFDSDLLQTYRLVAIDLPGHGRSEASGNPEDYSLPGLAAILVKAVQKLQKGNPYLLAGASLATNIVAEMLAHRHSSAGIVLSGPCIIGKGFPMEAMIRKDADPSPIFTDQPPEEAVKKYFLKTSASRQEEDITLLLEDYYRVKPPFRSSLLTTVNAGTYSDQLALLQKAGIPILCVFGKEDAIVEPSYLDTAPLQWWNGHIVKIDGASHLVNIDQPGAFNALLHAFAEDVFR